LTAGGVARAAAAGDDRLQEGRRIYNNHCYFCHGYDGDARTVANRFLRPPPRDFAALAPGELSREEMVRAVAEGRPDSAMMSFAQVLDRREIESVVDFIQNTFVGHGRANTRYHTAENGWPDHERYLDAFPFVDGTLALDADDAELTPAQRRGKQLFLSACVVCHDRGKPLDDRTLWERRAVSYPRGGYTHRHGADAQGVTDAVAGASLSAAHEVAPRLNDPAPQVRRGEELFQRNCAFCHARDGTGRNWIGSFLQPRPRDLTGDRLAAMAPERLREVIRAGLPDSAMPAWGTVLDDAEIDAVAAYVEAAFIRR
jgi:cytochrome c oxidase cbb3-type subunit 3